MLTPESRVEGLHLRQKGKSTSSDGCGERTRFLVVLLKPLRVSRLEFVRTIYHNVLVSECLAGA